MSYWATRVIISFFTVIPYVGESLAQWLQGDFVVSSVTLSRFFAFHIVAFPLANFSIHRHPYHCYMSLVQITQRVLILMHIKSQQRT